jgi:hypothetical protein
MVILMRAGGLRKLFISIKSFILSVLRAWIASSNCGSAVESFSWHWAVIFSAMSAFSAVTDSSKETFSLYFWASRFSISSVFISSSV